MAEYPLNITLQLTTGTIDASRIRCICLGCGRDDGHAWNCPGGAISSTASEPGALVKHKPASEVAKQSRLPWLAGLLRRIR